MRKESLICVMESAIAIDSRLGRLANDPLICFKDFGSEIEERLSHREKEPSFTVVPVVKVASDKKGQSRNEQQIVSTATFSDSMPTRVNE